MPKALVVSLSSRVADDCMQPSTPIDPVDLADDDPDILEARGHELLARAARLRAARRTANVADSWLTMEQAAKVAASTPRAIRGAGSRGELPIEHAGRRPVVRRSELERWLMSRQPPPVAKDDPRADVVEALERAAARVRRAG